MLTIGAITFTVYEPHHGMCPIRLQPWQMHALVASDDRADATPQPLQG